MIKQSNLKNILKDGYNIFAKAYTALIIDYRLICCILFVEHAIVIENKVRLKEDKEKDALNEKDFSYKIMHDSPERYVFFQNKLRWLSGAGKFLGLFIIFLQAVNAMQYTGNRAMGPWTNLMGCIAEWSFVIAGFCLLRKVN